MKVIEDGGEQRQDMSSLERLTFKIKQAVPASRQTYFNTGNEHEKNIQGEKQTHKTKT